MKGETRRGEEKEGNRDGDSTSFALSKSKRKLLRSGSQSQIEGRCIALHGLVFTHESLVVRAGETHLGNLIPNPYGDEYDLLEHPRCSGTSMKNSNRPQISAFSKASHTRAIEWVCLGGPLHCPFKFRKAPVWRVACRNARLCAS